MSASESPDVERLRAALARLGDEPGWPETDAERVFSALHGESTAEERREVVDELIQNPRAAAAWRLARELAPEPRADTPARSRMWTWMPIAATVLLMVGAAWLLQPWRSETPVYRSAAPSSIASLLPADVPLSREAAVLRWTAIEGARYRVRVLTPDLDLLEEAEDLPTAEYRLTPAVIARIPAGGRILWQVEARVAGTGAVVSPTFSARIE